MPFDRAGIRHRLHGAILRAEGRGQSLALPPHLRIKGAQAGGGGGRLWHGRHVGFLRARKKAPALDPYKFLREKFPATPTEGNAFLPKWFQQKEILSTAGAISGLSLILIKTGCDRKTSGK
jgi:hypothetical protein